MRPQIASPQWRGADRRMTAMGCLFVGISYLDQLRLEKTVYLLRHSTWTIKHIALECGFATDNYFHLVFRKAFGTTPSAFREKEVL